MLTVQFSTFRQLPTLGLRYWNFETDRNNRRQTILSWFNSQSVGKRFDIEQRRVRRTCLLFLNCTRK